MKAGVSVWMFAYKGQRHMTNSKSIGGGSMIVLRGSTLWSLLATWIVLVTTACVAASNEDHPNVLFFLVDDLGWRDVGCFGSTFYETPNVDRLAQQGVRFTNAYAACHVCSPTRASILTGKYPARLKLTDWLPGRRDFSFQRLLNIRSRQHLPYEETTLAEALKEAGYRTAAIGKWHLGSVPSSPEAHGFSEHVPHDWPNGAPNGTYYAPYRLQGLEGPEGEYLTDRLTTEAERFIESSQGEPFFLYLAHFAVHDPIQGRRDLVERDRDRLTQRPREGGPAFILEGNPDDVNPLSPEALAARARDPEYAGYRVLPRRTVKVKQHQDNVEFAGMVEAMDQSLGRLLNKLEALQLSEKTVIIFFSDNGGMAAANFGNPQRVVQKTALDRAYSTSNLPLRGAKGWLYEGGIRVPLIIKWPGQGLANVTCDVPVVSTDFYPTILDMADFPLRPEQHCDGLSLTPLLRGAKSLERDAIYWHFPHYSNHGMQSPCGAIRSGDYKLIEYFENNTVQLFDLSSDLGEQRDLAHAQPQRAAALREQLHVWRQSVGAEMPEPNPDYRSPR